MSRWFRLDDDVVNDPKVQSLPDALFRAWVNVLCVASKHGGQLPPLRDTAFILRLTDAKAAEILTKLCQAGLLDKDGNTFKPHNWDARQFKSDVSTERVRRFRNAKRNVSETKAETKPETPPDTETETETDSEVKTSGAAAPPDPAIAEREYFARGREILGKSAGGQLANLKKAKGGNVALARAALETASTKDNPAEYVAAAIRASPPGTAKPLTEFQRKQAETNDIRANLRDLASGGRSGGAIDRLLSEHPGERPEGLRGGTGSGLLALPGASGSRSN